MNNQSFLLSLARACLLLCIPVSITFANESSSCLGSLRSEASKQGISTKTFDQAVAGFEPDPDVIKAYEFQPEFRTAIWDYVAGLVDDERVEDGRARLKQWDRELAQIEQQYGVDRHVIVAVWGVESNFGRIQGRRELVRSLVTLVCANKRKPFFTGELMATLRIIQSGDIAQDALVGSWAGAFGQTQFMPTTYQRLAVDFDGDGKRDIVQSVPDALASTANYLKRAGWVMGEPWGVEVRLPKGYSGPSGRKDRQPLQSWLDRGIKPIGKGPIPGITANTPAALLLPAGTDGPAFLVFKNFTAVFSYNAAESYALSILHLSDRMKGGGLFMTPWPTDDAGISRAERREVQQRLLEKGFDIGEVDGMIGSKTREAIKAFQQQNGLAVDGRAGQRVLNALRSASSKP